MAPSIQNHRITMSYFRTCLTRWSRSQPLVYAIALKGGFPKPPGTKLRAPPLQFREATAPVKLPVYQCPLLRITGIVLESQIVQGGISQLAPPKPRFRVQSLPPILRRTPHNSLIEYSAKVHGVFSSSGGHPASSPGTTNSPGGLLRQSSDRYAIRAGRNLPDKEFRYLRTVIVTAAVHWGLQFKASPCG